MKNTPKYALAIFDMDGTILNTIDDLADSLNVILERYSMPLHTVDQVRFMVGNGIPKLIERAIPDGRDNPKFDEILKEYIAYYEEHSAIKTRPYDGIVEAVKSLRKSGVKIAVNTNKVEAAALDLVAKYFPDCFDIVSGSRPGLPPKPAPDGVYEILKRAGIDGKSQGQKAVFIGDSDVDLQTGINAGLDVIGVDWGFRGKAFLLEHGATEDNIVMKADELVEKIG
ncbi:MAG: HAD family hydrolase [Treponema sp.]|nr:HAD family hydrolase [Treponema sp.]